MSKLICKNCEAVFDETDGGRCPQCGTALPHIYDFKNSDEILKTEVPRVMDERKANGLEGMVGDLECVIINTEPDRLGAAVSELLGYTGLDLDDAFECDNFRTVILKANKGAAFIIRSRKGPNPFYVYNQAPKAKHLPNTRLETYVFSVEDIEEYVKIQQSRGVKFLGDDIIKGIDFSFIQTQPLKSMGSSIGVIQWHNDCGNYRTPNSRPLDLNIRKPESSHLTLIKDLDHTAFRVMAKDRDKTIIEFMELTNYRFEFAIYVKTFNSITNVARVSGGNFAMVFTSGITPYIDEDTAGPTERFIHNYGARVHHLAFNTEHIEDTFSKLQRDGMGFLIDLVGGPDEGLHQTFSEASPNTLLVNEYIHRYGDFDGFFTKSNVTLLTGATDKQ